MEYKHRLIEKEIEDSLNRVGCIILYGPKYCGKTTTAKRYAKSLFSINSIDDIRFANADPRIVLQGDTPRLIDEWQFAPDLWNVARSIIDERNNLSGQFIFTGSATPEDKTKIIHNGAGRIKKIKMTSMSLYETGESSGEISLMSLFDNSISIFALNEINLKDIAFYMCRGGWPAFIGLNDNAALKNSKDYYNTLFEFENNGNKKFRNKKKETFQKIIRSYARNISTPARKMKLINDISNNDDGTISLDTYNEYLEALNDLNIITDLNYFNLNNRSNISLITTPIRHFIDTSIAINSLNLTPEKLLNDPRSFGLFFEDFAIHELSVYANAINANLFHYRDKEGLECDAIIVLDDSRYALIEIKLGGQESIEYGAKTLKHVEQVLMNKGYNKPTFKAVITAVGHAYTTEDKIYVIPINKLKD